MTRPSKNLAAVLSGAVLCVAILHGCSGTPKVYTQQDPAADFSDYKTFAFADPLGTDRESGTQSLISTYLKTAAAREMTLRGYSLGDGAVDLLVNFYVKTEDKTKVTTLPAMTTGVGYYGYRGGFYSAWPTYGGETLVSQYTEGTLNVDLVDAKRNQLVWEGATSGRITEKVRKDAQTAVSAAVVEIFSAYPYRAGSNVSTLTEVKK